MDDTGWGLRILGLRLFERLLRFYPPRFRDEFSAEIRAVFLSRVSEADQHGRSTVLAAVLQEITGLFTSIVRESWHELSARKERAMASEDQLQKDAGAGGGELPALRQVAAPGVLWFAGWMLLTTAALPLAFVATAPLAALFLWLINLGVKTGFWSAAQTFNPEMPGFVISFALALAAVQSYLLRGFLPRASFWFIATAGGVFLGALAAGLALGGPSVQSWDPFWIMVTTLLSVGLALGVTHWLYLRRFLPNAFWIIFVDILGTASILTAGTTFTSFAELLILALPGVVTGLGLLLLLSQSRSKMLYPVRTEASQKNSRRFPRLAWAGLGLAALVPMFFVCIWIYAVSQLALAKSEGVYPTVEEAVIGNNSQGWGGAEVVRIEEVRAGPNRWDGTQPHVWFGGARVYLDRAPVGYDRDWYLAGSYYIHVREGWVLVPEGAFPEFIGWVMELYSMEDVDD